MSHWLFFLFLTEVLSTSDTLPRAPGMHSHHHCFRDMPTPLAFSDCSSCPTTGRLPSPSPFQSEKAKHETMHVCTAHTCYFSTQRGFLGNHLHHCLPHPSSLVSAGVSKDLFLYQDLRSVMFLFAIPTPLQEDFSMQNGDCA